MSFSTQVSAVSYLGNDSTATPYPVSFPVVSPDHIAVTIEDPTGSAPVLLSPAYYTVQYSGGAYSVTTVAPYPVTATVTVFRSLPFDQPFEFSQGGPLRTEEIGRAFDRVVMQIHQLWRELTAGEGGTVLPANGAALLPLAVWGDATDRASVQPAYDGQLGVQLFGKQVYMAYSTAVGDWQPYPTVSDSLLTVEVADERYVRQGAAAVEVANWTGIFGYGQSLSVGADGTPVVHDAAVHSHKTFSGGPNNPSGAALATSTPLFEVLVGNQGETPCSAMASGITQRLIARGEADRLIFTATAGVGGYAISGLGYGTAPFTRLISYHTAAAALAAAATATYKTSAVWWLQGESDAAGAMSQATYYAAFEDLANAITSATEAVVLTYQTAAYITTSSGPALAQLQADALDNVHFVTPIYFLALSAAAPNIHPSADSYQEIGFRMARGWSDLYEEGQVSRIRPLRAVQEGDLRVVMKFDVPTAPLVLNTTRVPATTDHGFKLIDSTGTVPFSSITLDGSDVVFLASRTITGALEVRYGLDYNTTPWINGAGGNLTDSTTDAVWISGVQRVLSHWCPAFKLTATKLTSPNYPQPIAGPESGAWEHWDLQTDAASLVGLVNARSLTPVTTVNYSADAVICPAGLGGFVNGLDTGFSDRLSYTGWAVIKRPVDAAGDYVFILGTADVVATSGAGLFAYGSTPTQMTVSAPGVTNFGRAWSDASVAVGDWCFVVYRSNAGVSGGMIGGAAFLEGGAVRTVPARDVAFGNAYVPYSNCDNELQIAEAGLFDSVLTETDINNLYGRAQSRMAARGISI